MDGYADGRSGVGQRQGRTVTEMTTMRGQKRSSALVCVVVMRAVEA